MKEALFMLAKRFYINLFTMEPTSGGNRIHN